MTPLPNNATDDQLIAFVDGWASLLEREDYEAAYASTEHDRYQGWTPILIRQVIKSYGEEHEGQRVTLDGVPSDVSQRKAVNRWESVGSDVVGEVWYDLNIDGVVSDLTATFRIVRNPLGLSIRLNDIHVM